MQNLERRHLVLAGLGLAAAGLVLQPRKLLTLLFLPLILAGILLGTLAFHLLLSYFAARTSARYKGSDHAEHHSQPIVPLLSIATASGLEAIRIRKQWLLSNTTFRIPLHPTSAKVSAAIDRLIAIILNNYLLSWYTVAISPSDPSFPNAVERTIREVLAEIRDLCIEVDWAKLGVSTLLPKITSHLELFSEAQQSLLESSASSKSGNTNPQPADPSALNRKKKQSPSAVPASEELDLLLSEKYAALLGSEGLHPAVSGASFNSRPSEEKHLRSLVERILDLVMPEREGSSKAVNVMTMEIVACAIIRPIIEAISDPDLWNRLLDEKAGAVIREQRMVNKLRAALDANPNIPKTPTVAMKKSEDISVKSTTKQFESFLRSLNRCPTLLEAKRLRNDIEINLRRARLPGSFPVESTESIVKYIDRLVLAKQAIDKRINELGGGESVSLNAKSPSSASTTLQDILHQPGALGFFMEHMDRKGRSMLVQFYLTVEGLKDPLEEDNEDSGYDAHPFDRVGDVDSASAQTLREDVQLLLTTYLSIKAVPVELGTTANLEAFQKAEGRPGQSMSKAIYRSTRRSIFAAQVQVYEDMLEMDWPTFQRSDLYVKAIAEMPTRTLHSALPSSPYRGKVLPSNASTSSRSSASASIQAKAGRPQPIKRAGTVSLAVSTPPKAYVRRSSDFAIPGRDDLFQSDKLDFLTGGAGVAEERSPLFREEQANTSLNGDAIPEEADDMDQLQTMEAIQEALSSILANDEIAKQDSARRSSRSPSIHSQTSLDTSSMVSPKAKVKRVSPQPTSPALDAPKRPFWHIRSASSRSQAEAPVDKDMEGEGSDVDEKGYRSGDELASSTTSLTTRLAAPGNLQLPVEIGRLGNRIEKLKNQESVLLALLRKADLTGSNDETKILQKSIDALRREVSELSFQKRQFSTQADENRLIPGRTSVNIVGTTVGQSQGKEFALYLVEVHQLEEDGVTQTTGWLVTRRFSEFVALHATLKDKLAAVRQLELPNKRLVTSLSSSLLQQRRSALERYLQSLIKIPGACHNPDVRAFLSQQNINLATPSSANTGDVGFLGDMIPGQGLIRNLFRSVTTGMDDLFGGPSMLDAIILRLSQQAADFAGSMNLSMQNEDLVSSVFGSNGNGAAGSGNDAPIDLLALSAGLSPVEGEGLTYFTAPIANLLVEIFDLKDKSSWLRRQAIIIILQQVLGGTIERKVREAITISLAGDALLPHIEMLTNMMWPDGKVKPPSIPRTAEDKAQTRESAYRKLAYLMPDVAASIIGRSNARRGARRIFAMMQNRRLTQHLIYTLLDDILIEIFGPKLKPGGLQ